MTFQWILLLKNMTFQYEVEIEFMTFQNNKIKNSAKMSKSHILAEVLPCFLKCHKIYRYNILKCHFYCAIIHLKSFDGGIFYAIS